MYFGSLHVFLVYNRLLLKVRIARMLQNHNSLFTCSMYMASLRVVRSSNNMPQVAVWGQGALPRLYVVYPSLNRSPCLVLSERE